MRGVLAHVELIRGMPFPFFLLSPRNGFEFSFPFIVIFFKPLETMICSEAIDDPRALPQSPNAACAWWACLHLPRATFSFDSIWLTDDSVCRTFLLLPALCSFFFVVCLDTSLSTKEGSSRPAGAGGGLILSRTFGR